jgi:hypothetical protein
VHVGPPRTFERIAKSKRPGGGLVDGGRKKEARACVDVYLHVGREEGELQRPAVLHAAGDHAGEDEPAEADRRGRVRRRRRAAAPAGAADAHRELELAVASSHGVRATPPPPPRSPEDPYMGRRPGGRIRIGIEAGTKGEAELWKALESRAEGVTRMERVGGGEGSEVRWERGE